MDRVDWVGLDWLHGVWKYARAWTWGLGLGDLGMAFIWVHTAWERNEHVISGWIGRFFKFWLDLYITTQGWPSFFLEMQKFEDEGQRYLVIFMKSTNTKILGST